MVTLIPEDKVVTTRRKVSSRDEALELVSALNRSAQSLPVFCAEHGIDGRSLQCWRRNLSRQPGTGDQRSVGLRLVELQLPATHATYRVIIGDVTIEVEDDFRKETLLRLFQVMDERC